jgi:hypothetical protein
MVYNSIPSSNLWNKLILDLHYGSEKDKADYQTNQLTGYYKNSGNGGAWKQVDY